MAFWPGRSQAGKILKEKQKRIKDDKFMIRMPNELDATVRALAATHERSINSEICYALEQWMHPRSHTRLICNLLGLGKRLESNEASLLHLAYMSIDRDDMSKIMNRFTDRQLQVVRDYANVKCCSMNHQFNHILNWWVDINAELSGHLEFVSAPG
ncbi:Arc family DNA-binding protein [Pseudomonas taiwanensis]|uniref:Arc family DNA-binding protein n=1 Tax=Pseudomonas taiwanensis TaxID=470150 RepID=UPI0028DF89B6|nr:Arc family DNA-binding protein [Pseudomonas taiwanensis]MDT8924687.1 Arc family DNA-binding protein [Pseudomonas taiwanensis]